ncbi:hypothetical protein D3C86_2012740 [compost metagenome]
MVSVSAHAITDDFRIDACATFLSVLKGLQNEYTSTFAHNKAITTCIKWTTCQMRLLIASRHCAQCTEACYTNWCNCRFSTATDHHVCIAALNHFE